MNIEAEEARVVVLVTVTLAAAGAAFFPTTIVPGLVDVNVVLPEETTTVVPNIVDVYSV